jgi:hypothetical protein
MEDSKEFLPAKIRQLEFKNPERLEELQFEVRWQLEYLVSAKKIVAKIVTQEVWDILASAKTQNQIDVCIAFLNKITKQRPIWKELVEDLSKCSPDEVILLLHDRSDMSIGEKRVCSRNFTRNDQNESCLNRHNRRSSDACTTKRRFKSHGSSLENLLRSVIYIIPISSFTNQIPSC